MATSVPLLVSSFARSAVRSNSELKMVAQVLPFPLSAPDGDVDALTTIGLEPEALFRLATYDGDDPVCRPSH